MSHTIHKYHFPIDDVFQLSIPISGKILKVDCQRDFPTMWILHSSNTPAHELRTFRVYGTGHEIKDLSKLTYIGTFQMHNGDLIWHVFEESGLSTTYIEDILTEQSETSHA